MKRDSDARLLHTVVMKAPAATNANDERELQDSVGDILNRMQMRAGRESRRNSINNALKRSRAGSSPALGASLQRPERLSGESSDWSSDTLARKRAQSVSEASSSISRACLSKGPLYCDIYRV